MPIRFSQTACVIPSLASSKKEPVALTSRDTRPRNMNALNRQLSEINWSEIINIDSCNRNMESLTSILTTTIDQCIPEQTRYVNYQSLRREPWLTAGLKQCIDKNKRLYGELLSTPTVKQGYKNYNNTLHKTLRKAKVAFYKDKCKEFKTQTKKLWRLINEIAGKKNDKSNLIEYLKIDDIQVYCKVFLWGWKEICC